MPELFAPPPSPPSHTHSHTLARTHSDNQLTAPLSRFRILVHARTLADAAQQDGCMPAPDPSNTTRRCHASVAVCAWDGERAGAGGEGGGGGDRRGKIAEQRCMCLWFCTCKVPPPPNVATPQCARPAKTACRQSNFALTATNAPATGSLRTACSPTQRIKGATTGAHCSGRGVLIRTHLEYCTMPWRLLRRVA